MLHLNYVPFGFSRRVWGKFTGTRVCREPGRLKPVLQTILQADWDGYATELPTSSRRYGRLPVSRYEALKVTSLMQPRPAPPRSSSAVSLDKLAWIQDAVGVQGTFERLVQGLHFR